MIAPQAFHKSPRWWNSPRGAEDPERCPLLAADRSRTPLAVVDEPTQVGVPVGCRVRWPVPAVKAPVVVRVIGSGSVKAVMSKVRRAGPG
jgi:hypothetical protein